MIVAVVALAGALLIQSRGLALDVAPASPADAVLAASDLGGLTAGEGTFTVSTQALDAVSTGSGLVQSGAARNLIRTGDIAMDAAGQSGFAGVRAVSVNTGQGSIAQSAVSIAAGSVLTSGPGAPR